MNTISFLGRFVLQVIGGFILGGLLSYIFYISIEVDNNPGLLLNASVLFKIVIPIIGFLIGFSAGFVIVWLTLISVFKKKNNDTNKESIRGFDENKISAKNSPDSNGEEETLNIEDEKIIQNEDVINLDSEEKFSFFNEFLTTKERLSRKSFFYRILILLVIKYAIIFYIEFDDDFFSPSFFDDGTINSIIFLLVSQAIIFIFFLIQIIRRLSDINLSHWYSLIYFLPLADWIFLIYLSLKEGTIGNNDYGPEPKNINPIKNLLINEDQKDKNGDSYKLFDFKKQK